MREFLRTLRRMNHASTLSMLALVAIGIAFIYSVGTHGSGQVALKYRSQALTACAGLAAYFALAHFDYRKYAWRAAVPFYAATIVLLAAVPIFGTELNNAKRWLWGFQPSEIAKVSVIMLLAAACGTGRLGRGFGAFAACAAIIALPCALVLMQPDLGTVLVLAAAGAAMLLCARVWTTGLLAALSACAVAAFLELGLVARAEREPDPEKRAEILRWTGLRRHQIDRLRVFLYPEKDRTGAGFHLHQAKMSVGAGGLRGRGFGRGLQIQNRYMQTSKSISDFIFAAFAEEAGFAGCTAVLALYATMLAAGAATAFKTKDDGGRLLAAGACTLLFCHVYENVAMNIGLMPITGLPLPFVSYGRTSLVTFMALNGLVQSVAVHSAASGETKE